MIINCRNNPFQASIEASSEAKLFSYIEKWLKRHSSGRYAAIAGSYALHALMCSSGQSEYTNQHGFVPNDIDIYVNAPMMMIFMMVANFASRHSEYALANFQFTDSYDFNASTAIHGILEFYLVGFDKSTKVQLICWNPSLTFSCAYELAHAVILGFDISVCRVALTSSKQLSKFYFCNQEDAVDVYLHRFKIQMKPRETTTTVFHRILKYTDRGFHLYQFIFQDGVIAGCFTITETFDQQE